MKALSLRSPWWWAVLTGKDIENRDWRTNVRGRILVHASKWYNAKEIEADLETIWKIGRIEMGGLDGAPQILDRLAGHVVGSVEIIGCVSESNSPWFFGKYGFVLRNPISFTNPFPFKGALGFFDVPDQLARAAGEEI